MLSVVPQSYNEDASASQFDLFLRPNRFHRLFWFIWLVFFIFTFTE